MEAILKTIAREYSIRYENLKQVCFLFPNKRCGVFLKKYLSEYGKKSEDMPHILTITEFMSQISRIPEADRIIQMFCLFEAYKKVAGEKQAEDFEAFRVWGESVLSDFNTIDFYLVEADKIFRNIKDFREIKVNFLTEEQKEVIREYFGIEEFDEEESFWKSFGSPEDESELKKKFLNLWQIMYPLYDEFNRILRERKTGYAGNIYRKAAEILERRGNSVIPYKKIVAVGFNALTEAERRVFKSLQESEGKEGYDDFADFIWDATGPILKDKTFTASRFVAFNKKKFPSPEWISPALASVEVEEFPEIEIISAPSNSAQAKVASELLMKYEKPENRNMVADAQVALILPDETLLSNILFSLPDDIGDINLTMSYNLRQTSIASFMYQLRRVYATSRISKEDETIFYSKDLKTFLTHPYSLFLFDPTGIENLLSYITDYHRVSLTLKDIELYIPEADKVLKFPSEESSSKEVLTYISEVFETLISGITTATENESDNQDLNYVSIYLKYVKDFAVAVSQFDIKLSPLSIFRMIDRLVAAEKIGFEGEPLSGLQVMGTLESRSIDFKHVIILSMNEGLMPRTTVTPSFIPDSLRKGYGLPPARYAEEIFGYYFYRLLSRADRVSLVYDGRAISGLRGGESRYLQQLKELVPENKLVKETWQFRLQKQETSEVSIVKTPEIIEMTGAFCKNGPERKNLSASTLNTYRECEIKFFIQNILNISSDPEKEEYMDAISVGNVLHKVMMELYMPKEYQQKLLDKPLRITLELLNNLSEHPELIKLLVRKNINEIYYGSPEASNSNLKSGVTEILADQISHLVEEIVRYDKRYAPFNLYGCEISENMKVRLGTGREVNFRFAIDRLDEIEVEGEKRLRIIDYKTGSKKRKASSLEKVFEGGYESEQIFQLFTYAWLLGKKGIKDWENVITEIYFVPDLVKDKRGLPEIAEEAVTSFKPYAKEFSRGIENLVETIFSSEKFNGCEDETVCRLCNFRSLCGK